MMEQLFFKKLIDSLWPIITNKASLAKKLRNLNATNAYLSAANVKKVKTIWQIDKEVCLHDFYYPSKIQIDDTEIKVEGLNSFPENGKFIVQGTAGQGKSILMRYITGIELEKATTLPIFIELRKISEKKSLTDLILDNLKEIGLDIDFTELDSLLSTGKCSLILDAFDEIPNALVHDTITTIESICNQHYNCCIIISSRPNSDIQKSAFFRVANLNELTPEDFEPLLNKLFFSTGNNTKNILNAIHSSESHVVEVITTPLLFTLLVIIYKSFNEIPNNLAEFYSKLFTVLCYRHDSTKPGFKREFATGLTESQLSKLFDSFCFCCMKAKKSSLTKSEAVKLADEAIALSNSKIDNAELFLNDITKVTCLVVEEGFEYHFIHKSIREFHAAHYLKEYAQENTKIKFYTHASKNYETYVQELKFLETIDEYNYKKHFLIPHIDNTFLALNIDKEAIKDTIDIKNLFGETYLTISNNGSILGSESNMNYNYNNFMYNVYYHITWIPFRLLNDRNLKKYNKLKTEDIGNGTYKLNLFKIIKLEKLNEVLLQEILLFFNNINKDRLEAISYIKKADAINESIIF
ncbi:NACHT domain-containing protein [Shewanella sp. NKUCC05_KAH]|uniref:NACHT domain-containing protein n=1 Tax=Shewanella sp. NKUCC05_KAH TaxID=2842126 RepID=UPI001C5A8E13|nr:NACHT domain-containing protein [Shewanella sp. NKUCC05_KAH]MBW3527233.1 NACHT domain-containing protein [Shewanella sp. NKUCC05_KAH]